MDLMTAAATIGHALDVVKKLQDLEKDFDEAVFKREIANLMVALAQSQTALAQAQMELTARDAEIAHLRQVQSGKIPVVQYNGYDFGIGNNGKPIGLPFCRTCTQRSGMQNQLAEVGSGYLVCTVCNTVVTDAPKALPHGLWPNAG